MKFCVLLTLILNSEISEGGVYLDEDFPVYERNEFSCFDFRGNIRQFFTVLVSLGSEYNVICSPVSAMMPLAKLLIGAKKQSSSELELLAALGLENEAEINATSKQLIKDIKNLEGVTAYIASRIFVSVDKTLHPIFERKSQLIFGSSIYFVNTKYPAKVAKYINGWVHANTNQLLDNIVNEEDITPDTSLFLVNAVYFKGYWEKPFHRFYTDRFYSPSGEVNVNMMIKTDDFDYVRSTELNSEIVQLPYLGGQSAMIIVLPDAKDGLQILLHTLRISPHLLNKALMKMKMTSLKVVIPKFKIETTLDLKECYDQLGIKSVLKSNESQLNHIVRSETVHITKAIHKVFIEVNELGTEAAAASAVQVLPQMAPLLYDIFKADHPFLFYIRVHHEQLFSGVVVKP